VIDAVVSISSLDDAFSEILELEARPEEGDQLQQKGKKRRKKKGGKNKVPKSLRRRSLSRLKILI